MNDNEISKIRDEVFAEFGIPDTPRVDKDWLLVESARRTLIGNVSEPECIAPLIDHTLLSANATRDNILNLCAEAREYRFASVCVNPCWVPLAAVELEDKYSIVCSVIGFPLGANATEIKADEALRAVDDGAEEIDMVINNGYVKSSMWESVHADIVSVVEAVAPTPIKVIIETCLLDETEIARTSLISISAGAAYVKTSTGFSSHGATIEAVNLMSRVVGENFGVKASGGIGDFDSAMRMIEAGATRIGTSRSIRIISR